MFKKLLPIVAVLFSITANSQDFSNKGKDFWLCFPQHVPTNVTTTLATLSIFITSDKASTGTITMPNGAFSATFNIAANGLQEIQIPHSTTRHISNGESSNETITQILNKSIRIKVDAGQPAVVAYAQQWAGARSAATLLLPVNVLGRKYYAISFTQNGSNTPNTSPIYNARSQFQIIATKPNTVVEITPVKNGVVGTKFTVNLPLEGDMIQYQSPDVTASSQDLTGTFIESVASGSGGCLPIAVYSGSSNITFGSTPPNCSGGSYDPLWQQLYPATTWGKNFGFIPFGDYLTRGNPYRVMASENNTNVYFDGALVANLNAGQIYPAAFTSIPAVIINPTNITADKPVCVAQYAQADACSGQPNNPPPPQPATKVGDPDMVILNPIEQNISDITIFTSNRQNITKPWVNVLMKTIAIPSFRINGGVPGTAWQAFPTLPGYSYLRHLFPAGANSYRLTADSGFNAICYGWGNVESYAYSAGTNVRDLYQQIGVSSQYGIETTPSVCTNSPFRFKVSLPYCADSIRFDLSNLPGPPVPSTVLMQYSTCVPGTGGPDSTTIVNGVTLYWYSLPSLYSFSVTGTFPVTITTYSPNASGCGSEQLIEFDLVISNPPVANFTWTGSGCVAEPMQFTETTPQLPKPTYKWWWNFDDPGSGALNIDSVRNPSHLFSAPGTYNVKFVSITTPGCLTDTISRTITILPLPNATISGTASVCINGAPQPITFTGSGGTSPYTFFYTIDAGAGPGPTQSVNSVTGNVATIMAPTTTAGTFIYKLDSVRNTGSTLCNRLVSGQTATVTVLPNHAIALSSAAATTNQTVCINTAIIPITYNLSGGATNVTISGLPAGVTGTVVGSVLTISGSPATTVGSPFAYAITTTGNACLPATALGTITVSPDHAITLSSAAPTTSQTVCINTAITTITYTLSGGATGATITGLPAGVTSSVVGNTVTISGIPSTTVGSPFTYSIVTTGNACVVANTAGTISVLANHAIALSSAASTTSQTVCINNAIIPITYNLSGGATNVTITGLPAGVSGSVVGSVLTISGTPTTTVGSPFPYSITTTGNACLTASAIGTITVLPDHTIILSSAAATTNQSVCMNTAIIPITYTLGGGATGTTVTGLPAGVTAVVTGSVLTISGAPSTAVGSPFSYTIVTTGNACITATLGGTITVHQLPTANFTYTIPSCNTRTISFTDGSVPNTGSLTGWAWNFGDPASGVNNTSISQNPTHVFAAAGTYNVTLIATTNLGCSNAVPFSQMVTVNDRPVAGFIIPDVCLSDTYAQFIDTSTVAAGTIVAWAWNFGDPISGVNNTSILPNPQHSYTSVGLYNVQLIVTSNSGCRDTIVQVLSVNGSFPVANFNINNPTTLCANDSVRIVNTSTVFPGNITKVEIYWDNVNFPAVLVVDNTPPVGGTYSHLYPNFQTPLTRNFTIRFRAYSGGVCVNDRLQTITVNAAPRVQFNNIPDTCLLVNPFQITQATEIGAVPGTGVFTGPGIITPGGMFSPAVAGVGTHTIKYTFTSTTGGCVDSLSKTIRVLDTASAKFIFTLPVCDGVPASFTDQSTAPAGVVLATTVWDFSDGSPLENHPPASTFTHLFPAPGQYTVTMYNTSVYGCNSPSYTLSVTVDPNHAISLSSAAGSNNQSVCINFAITPITYTLSGGATGATVTGLPTGVTSSLTGNILTITGAPSISVGSPFAFSIVTTGNTCLTATATGTIAVSADHSITLTSASTTANQSICIFSTAANIVYTLGGGATGATVTGLPPGVTSNLVGNILTISGIPNTTTGSPFNYSINTTGNNCIIASQAGVIKVNPKPIPKFNVDKLNYCVPNAVVGFVNTSTIEDGTENAFTFLWNFGEPSSGSSNTSVQKNPSHWYSGTGPYTVNLQVTSGDGCVHDTSIVINNIHPQPVADFSISKPSICIGEFVTFTDNSNGRDGIINQWNWNMGDGNVVYTNPVNYLFKDTITYTVTFFARNNFGCNTDTISKLFTVYPYPKVNAGPDRVILEGGSIQLDAIVSGNDLQFLWTPNLYLSDNKIQKPRVNKPLTDMTYRLTVTARGGCSLPDDVFVKLLKFPVIPNTFTPNNDGINDTWRIDYLNTYPQNRVQVFTRAGQLIFESRGYNQPWDGTIKGKTLPLDTYYYIIEPGNGREPITGYVTILK